MRRGLDDSDFDRHEVEARKFFVNKDEDFIILAASQSVLAEQLGSALNRIDTLELAREYFSVALGKVLRRIDALERQWTEREAYEAEMRERESS